MSLIFTSDTPVSRRDAEDEGEKTLEEDQSRSQREVWCFFPESSY